MLLHCSLTYCVLFWFEEIKRIRSEIRRASIQRSFKSTYPWWHDDLYITTRALQLRWNEVYGLPYLIYRNLLSFEGIHMTHTSLQNQIWKVSILHLGTHVILVSLQEEGKANNLFPHINNRIHIRWELFYWDCSQYFLIVVLILYGSRWTIHQQKYALRICCGQLDVSWLNPGFLINHVILNCPNDVHPSQSFHQFESHLFTVLHDSIYVYSHQVKYYCSFAQERILRFLFLFYF